MQSASALRRLGRIGALILFGALVVPAHGCADGLSPLSSASAPTGLAATVLRPGAVSLRWTPAAATRGSVRAYIIERRENQSGSFREVARVEPSSLSEESWIDTDVRPETIYGYRVVAVTTLGDRSAPSTVGGAVTPPPPGLEIVTTSAVISAESLDPDGYQIMIMGPDTVRAAVNTSGTRRFMPLKPGAYTVTLTGVIERCAATNPSQQVTVTDTTARTLTQVRFQVTCRDPNRGDLTVVVNQTGPLQDPAVTIDVLGQASDSTLSAADRVFSAQRTITSGAPSVTFANVRPGTFTVSAKDLAGNCALDGSASRTANVAALATATVTFAVACRDTMPPPPTSNAPFIWRNTWTPKSAASGTAVTLEATLDLRARPSRAVKGVQAEVTYDPAVLRYVGRTATDLEAVTVNTATPGLIRLIAATADAAKSGLVSIARFRFTAIGANGAVSATTTASVLAGSPEPFQDSVRVVEDTFTVGTGTVVPGPTNQPPVARAGGPYTGVAGTALVLSGAGSTDPDGTIASYSWAFGDNTSATGVGPSKTYATAGTYTATLTVTDDKGASASSTASVTITPPGSPPGGTAPVARANGPYSSTVGTAITLSSTGTTNAASYNWTLGNGQTATGASPSVTYTAAGTFPITLTVTGAGGLSSTSTTSITVSAASPTPTPSPTTLSWRNVVGPFDVANNTVSITILYDTRVNLTETPGAEALEKFAVDSLMWNPSVLQFVSINLGPNINGTSNQIGAPAGRLALQGTIGGAQQQGLITIATIRLRPVGSSNATTTTRTFLGALLGPASTNFFSYNAKTTITEGQFTVP